MPTILADEQIAAARKNHRCHWCWRVIAVGESYRRTRMIGYDGPYVFKACAHCDAFVACADLWELDWSGEGLGVDHIADYEPDTFEHARWLIQWRRKWQRRDGSLYPVPGVA